MPGFLLDTNAVSALAPLPSEAPASSQTTAFSAWVRAHDDELFLSAVTLGEIQAGISKLERRGASARARRLSQWLAAILELYEARILALDARAALTAGRCLDRAVGKGGSPGFEDAAIAGTAIIHDLTIVTANVKHFELLGVPYMRLPV
jgi:predicted nucleic acid-binding protein